MTVSQTRQQWSQVLNRVFRKEAQVIVEKSGIPVAAIISADDLDRLKQFDKRRQEQFAVLHRMREAFKDVPSEEIEAEVAKAIREVRDDRQQQDRLSSV